MRDLNGMYENCRLCPRGCGVNRLGGQRGICGMSSVIEAASAVLHRGEEPLLLGEHGSGAVFFSGCTLRCPFCQNVQISCGREVRGAGLTIEELAGIFLQLESRGAANINLVTATQFAPSIVSAADNARTEGLSLPIMWNSSGYELPGTVRMLGETVDIWLPDIKTLDPKTASRLFNTPGYPKAVEKTVKAMAGQLRNKGGRLIDGDEMKRGMIVRHLVMPGELESSRQVLEWFSRNLLEDAMLSLMVQYIPVSGNDRTQNAGGYAISEEEYEKLMGWLDEYGIEEGFLQEPEAASAEWIPDFDRTNPFPDEFSTPVWHWKEGWV